VKKEKGGEKNNWLKQY